MRLCIHAGKHFEGACKTHSGEKSNKCNQCMFASSHTSALRTHLKRHSGERPYKCNQCDYASSHVFSLKTHLKTHSEEKSNKSGSIGIENLIDKLKEMTFKPTRDPNGPFIFSVDHCFLIKGQGTVMTGTVLSGSVQVNAVIIFKFNYLL